MSSTITINVVHTLADISAETWNQFNPDNQPFLRHEFLLGMENFDCLGEHVGWYPHHLLAYDQDDKLVAAMPCYEKHNSFGEFVFDWQWASAYEQSGLPYYPKLLSAIPFSPITGSRLLCLEKDRHAELYADFTRKFIALTEQKRYSSAHILFLPTAEKEAFSEHAFLNRLGYQYHWHNKNYASFDDFLASFSSKKRRNVKRERRLAMDIEGIEIEQRYGKDLNDDEWQTVYRCYQSTFHHKGNFPSLTLAFFKHLADSIGEQIVIFIARQHGDIIAASICFKSDTTLYGRYWGCLQDVDCLHFELCFYQGIDYCIQHQLQCFEPGAQGEHKISRGFLPQETWSCHYIAHPSFKQAIDDFLKREKSHMQEQVLGYLNKLSPFK